MKSKLLILSLFVSFISFGQKLPITGLCLSDILGVTGGTCLSHAFTNANSAYFDPAYAVSGSCLNDFRNYGAGGACTRPAGLTTMAFYFSCDGVTVSASNVCSIALYNAYGYFGYTFTAEGDSVYGGDSWDTDCAKISDGYYLMTPYAETTPVYPVRVLSGVLHYLDCDIPSMYTAEDYTATGTQIAITGNEVLSDGGSSITEKGVAYGTSVNPTISGSHTSDGSGTATYNSTLTGLSLNTLYYVRAYGTNSSGTGYGANVEMLSASITTPTVTTDNGCFMDADNAVIEGTVSADGGATVTDRGFCYSTSNSTPTTADTVRPRGSGTGYFNWEPSGILPQNTTIYIRAYATNSVGTSYGDVYTINSNELCN